MDPKFFRKYADIIDEAGPVPAPAATTPPKPGTTPPAAKPTPPAPATPKPSGPAPAGGNVPPNSPKQIPPATAPGTTPPTASVGGLSQSADAKTGDVTKSFNVGDVSVSSTQTPGGFTKQTTADYDMGPAGTASMVKSAPQQPGQLAGTTTVTRTGSAGPKYDADAGVFGNAPSAQPASGSAVQGVAFGGASGKNVGNNVVTTGDADLAAQAKAVMPAPNTNLEENDDEAEFQRLKEFLAKPY